MFDIKKIKIGVIGMGYVGLPLACQFAKKTKVVGFDIDSKRISQLNKGVDTTKEIEDNELLKNSNLTYSSSLEDIKNCNVYIVTVPTPIDSNKNPDLTPLQKASESIAKVIDRNDFVIYESTVYPGATEDECITIIENLTGLKLNVDFYAGYSPERINPGDKERPVESILKVTSGSCDYAANFVDSLYQQIITAGTFKASSIKVAESAKLIENVQRDVNIALINELYQIFSRLNINTNDVIEAASTKWNFMKLVPGLVGGHCIGVDPFYLLHKAKTVGYVPDVIRSAREINDAMPEFVVNRFISELFSLKINPIGAKVVILGFTFKADCPDTRNTKAENVIIILKSMGFDVAVYDPVMDVADRSNYPDVNFLDSFPVNYNVGFIVTEHQQLMEKIFDYKKSLTSEYIYDYRRA